MSLTTLVSRLSRLVVSCLIVSCRCPRGGGASSLIVSSLVNSFLVVAYRLSSYYVVSRRVTSSFVVSFRLFFVVLYRHSSCSAEPSRVVSCIFYFSAMALDGLENLLLRFITSPPDAGVVELIAGSILIVQQIHFAHWLMQILYPVRCHLVQ